VIPEQLPGDVDEQRVQDVVVRDVIRRDDLGHRVDRVLAEGDRFVIPQWLAQVVETESRAEEYDRGKKKPVAAADRSGVASTDALIARCEAPHGVIYAMAIDTLDLFSAS
jgi:hypothetical protein